MEIRVFGFPVQVNYKFYWPEKRDENQKDPLVSHIEYRCESHIISETVYRSHFFFTQGLRNTQLKDIEKLVTTFAESYLLKMVINHLHKVK